MCTSDDEALARWCEHYQNALNHLHGVPDPVLEEEAGNAGDDIQTSVDEPTLHEVRNAVRKLRNGRAPGRNGRHPWRTFEMCNWSCKCCTSPTVHQSLALWNRSS